MSEQAYRAYAALAADVGIPLPDALGRMIRDSRTQYGANAETWHTHWHQLMRQHPPALVSTDDLDWIDAARARETVETWLHPRWQQGRSFLPFARSGAGDAYCLMHLDPHRTGVALIWRDNPQSCIGYGSFADFLLIKLVETLEDFSHLLDDFSAVEATQCVTNDARALAPYLPVDYFAPLRPYLERQAFASADTLGLIRPDEAQALIAGVDQPGQAPFPVTPRWEISPQPSAHQA